MADFNDEDRDFLDWLREQFDEEYPDEEDE